MIMLINVGYDDVDNSNNNNDVAGDDTYINNDKVGNDNDDNKNGNDDYIMTNKGSLLQRVLEEWNAKDIN